MLTRRQIWRKTPSKDNSYSMTYANMFPSLMRVSSSISNITNTDKGVYDSTDESIITVDTDDLYEPNPPSAHNISTSGTNIKILINEINAANSSSNSPLYNCPSDDSLFPDFISNISNSQKDKRISPSFVLNDKKKVRFLETVNVIKIPTRRQLKPYMNDLYWNINECEHFKKDAFEELSLFSSTFNCSLQEAVIMLFQENINHLYTKENRHIPSFGRSLGFPMPLTPPKTVTVAMSASMASHDSSSVSTKSCLSKQQPPQQQNQQSVSLSSSTSSSSPSPSSFSPLQRLFYHSPHQQQKQQQHQQHQANHSNCNQSHPLSLVHHQDSLLTVHSSSAASRLRLTSSYGSFQSGHTDAESDIDVDHDVSNTSSSFSNTISTNTNSVNKPSASSSTSLHSSSTTGSSVANQADHHHQQQSQLQTGVNKKYLIHKLKYLSIEFSEEPPQEQETSKPII